MGAGIPQLDGFFRGRLGAGKVVLADVNLDKILQVLDGRRCFLRRQEEFVQLFPCLDVERVDFRDQLQHFDQPGRLGFRVQSHG